MDPILNSPGEQTSAASAAADAAAHDQKRRSSSRSIKRKRFDDEIVEYSLGLPPTQVSRIGRARTTSQTYVNTFPAPTLPPPSPLADTTPLAQQQMTTTNLTSPTQLPSPPPPPPQSKQASLAASADQPAAAAPALLNSPIIISTPSVSSTPTIPAVSAVAPVSITLAPSMPLQTKPVIVSSTAAPPPPPTPTQIPAPSMASTPLPERRRMPKTSHNLAAALQHHHGQHAAAAASSGGGGVLAHLASGGAAAAAAAAAAATVGHSKKAKKKGVASAGVGSAAVAATAVGQHSLTKDLGRWKPIDDLALIIGIQQTNDLRMVHRGTKFSCKFTVQEMQSRWYSLLYEESISRIAVAAMRNLHPELVESVQSRALYTVAEEDLLGTIKSSENPNMETFQDLLDKHAQVFYPARTAKALSTHWQLMKQYSLLPDQNIQALHKADSLVGFSDAEELLNDTELIESKDDALEIELALADRTSKKEIRQLENELTRWTVLVDSLTGVGFTPEFDNQTLAVLRGRLVRYLMRSREITFGRTTKEQTVDVDLTLEGPAHKVSRKQGTIKLRSNGDFFVSNEGKRPLYVDGMPLLHGNKMRLNNNCVVEMAGLRFIFLTNNELINAIRQESAKMDGPLN